MRKIYTNSHFDRELKRYIKKDNKNQSLIKLVLIRLLHNFKHPSLNTEKLKGKGLYTVRITKGDRLWFKVLDDDSILLLDIGKHDKYRRI